MGLFQHRPEDPTEWAGLPSEPAYTESVDRLPDTVSGDLYGIASLDSIAIPSESVSVPLPDADDDAG